MAHCDRPRRIGLRPHRSGDGREQGSTSSKLQE
jgi:hypothetical protein